MEALPTDFKSAIALFMGVLAARLSIFIVNQIKMVSWTADRCTYTGLAIAGVIGMGAYGVGIAMLWNPMPGDWRAWVDTMISVGIVTAMASKVWYDAKLPWSGHQ